MLKNIKPQLLAGLTAVIMLAVFIHSTDITSFLQRIRGGDAALIAATGTCKITPSADTVTNRIVQMNMAGCAGVQRFQISENADFRHPSGVTLSLENQKSDFSGAEVLINYGDGSDGSVERPYTLPEKRTFNALAVVYTFVDAEGRDHGPGVFETPTWANRLVFGDGVAGHDGYYLKNSVKDHISQSTAGRVTLTGKTYPKIVKIPLEKFRGFLTTPPPKIIDEIRAAIEKEDPAFLNEQFDYYYALSSAYYAVDRGYNVSGNVVYDVLRYDSTTSIFANTIEETRTSHDATTVVPRYNPRSVEGVWLKSDTARTGTNYYSGGTMTWHNGNTDYKYITLGTPLPAANSEVVVRYSADAAAPMKSVATDAVTTDGWYSHWLHENYHAMSNLKAMSYKATHIGDPYIEPTLMPSYDMMTNERSKLTHPQYTYYEGAPLLSAVNRYMLGYVNPLTLAYGAKDKRVTLTQTSFVDASSVENTPTIIKIPLRKIGDPGLYTKRRGGYYNATGMQNTYANNAAPQYTGEEYLMLEWRSPKQFANKVYNFDEAILSGGLVAYHVVEEGNPYGSTLHSGQEIVDNIDATPPYLGGYSNVTASPAAFSTEGGVTSVSLQEIWQEKPLSADSHTFKYLLSEGRGTKTLYARFVDGAGTVLGTQTFSVQLDSDARAIEFLPTLTAPTIKKGYTATSYNIPMSWATPLGDEQLYVSRDGVRVWDKNLNGTSSGSETYYFNSTDMTSGKHVFRIELFDKGNNRAEQWLEFDTVTGTSVVITPSSTTPVPPPPPPPSAPTVSFGANPASPTTGGSVTLTWTSENSTSCTASGGWSGTKTVNGSETLSNLSETKSYTLTCTNSGGDTAKTVTVTVTQPPPDPNPEPSDTTAPTISSLTAALSRAKVKVMEVSWTTNESTTGTVFYGTNTASLTSTAASSVTGTTHKVPLTTLAKRTTYYYKVEAVDAAGNKTTSPVKSFKTP